MVKLNANEVAKNRVKRVVQIILYDVWTRGKKMYLGFVTFSLAGKFLADLGRNPCIRSGGGLFLACDGTLLGCIFNWLGLDVGKSVVAFEGVLIEWGPTLFTIFCSGGDLLYFQITDSKNGLMRLIWTRCVWLISYYFLYEN